MLYPETKTRVIYDITQVGLLLWVMYVVPLRIAFGEQPPVFSSGFWMDVFVDLMLLLDLVIQMFTYYVDGRTGHWIHNPKKIRARYFRGWFWVDLLAVVPIDHILRIMHAMDETITDSRAFRILRLARLFRYLRLFKLLNTKRITKVVQNYRELVGLSSMALDYAFKLIVMFLAILCFNHLAGCMWIFIGRSYSGHVPDGLRALVDEGEVFVKPELHIGWWDELYGPKAQLNITVTEWEQYVDAIYFSMVTITSVGYGDITPENHHEKFFCYWLLFVTCFTYSYLIGIFADIVSNSRSDSNIFERKMRSVFEFLDHVDCPRDLQGHIQNFYAARYPRKTLFDEGMIYNELPTKFSQRLVLHRFSSTIQRVPLFRNIEPECTVMICRQLRTFTANKGDTIIAKNEPNSELFIMVRGYANGTDGYIETNYRHGDFFGELEFVGLGTQSTSTVMAMEFCSLYGLRYVDLLDTLKVFPDLKNRLYLYAQQRKEAMDAVRGDRSPSHRSSPRVGDLLHTGGAADNHSNVVEGAEYLKSAGRANMEGLLLDLLAKKKIKMSDLQKL